MSANFKPDQAGWREMAVSPEIEAALLATAEKGKAEAEAMSSDFVETGEYASSFNVRPEIRSGFGSHPIATAILENTSDHAAAVEWGYAGRANAPGRAAHRVLGRVLDELERHE